MHIRKLQIADIHAACALVCETADNVMINYETPQSINALKAERTHAKIVEKLQNRDYIVAEKNWKIVWVWWIKDNEIRTMFVDYKNIKKWIWSKIIEALETIATNKKYTKINVKANEWAKNFYKKKWYKFIKEYEEAVWDTTYKVVFMEKSLP